MATLAAPGAAAAEGADDEPAEYIGPKPPPPPPPPAAETDALPVNWRGNHAATTRLLPPTVLRYQALRAGVLQHAFQSVAHHARHLVEAALERDKTSTKLSPTLRLLFPFLDHGAELAAEVAMACGANHTDAMELVLVAQGALPMDDRKAWAYASGRQVRVSADMTIAVAMARACSSDGSAGARAQRSASVLKTLVEHLSRPLRARPIARRGVKWCPADSALAARKLMLVLEFVRWRCAEGFPSTEGGGALAALFPASGGTANASKRHKHLLALLEDADGMGGTPDVALAYVHASAAHAKGDVATSDAVLARACDGVVANADATALRAAYAVHARAAGENAAATPIATPSLAPVISAHLQRDTSHPDWIECLAAQHADATERLSAILSPLITHATEHPKASYGWRRLAKSFADAAPPMPTTRHRRGKTELPVFAAVEKQRERIEMFDDLALTLPWKRAAEEFMHAWKMLPRAHAAKPSADTQTVEESGCTIPVPSLSFMDYLMSQFILPEENGKWRISRDQRAFISTLRFWCTSSRHGKVPTPTRVMLQEVTKQLDRVKRRAIFITNFYRMLVTMSLTLWVQRDTPPVSHGLNYNPHAALLNSLVLASMQWCFFAGVEPTIYKRRRLLVDGSKVKESLLPPPPPPPPAKKRRSKKKPPPPPVPPVRRHRRVLVSSPPPPPKKLKSTS